MNKAIFLDRDGTINVDYGYVYKISDFKFINGVIEGLKILNDLGYTLIVITNQSGIGRGFYKKNDFEKLTNYMLDELKKNNIFIKKVYYCPHISEDNCNCRKPKLGLFYKAIDEFNIDIDSSFVIGDRIRDLAICDKTKIKGILITPDVNGEYVCKNNLFEAAKYIKEISGSDI